MHDRACLGDRSNAYSLGTIELRARCTIAQEAYLCTGTHDFSVINLSLQTAPIVVGEDCFVGARAFILPGVTLGDRSIIGACSVVSKDVPADQIVAGQPAKLIRMRPRLQ